MKIKFRINKKIILVIGLCILFFVFGFISRGFFIKSTSISYVLSDVDEIINYNSNLSYTQEIFERCSVLENATEKFLCVNKFAVANYNMVPREDIYSIDEMFDNGADCKSYAVYYATLAKMMGYNYAFFRTENHIMTIAYFPEGYCILDLKFAQCINYEQNINNSEVLS